MPRRRSNEHRLTPLELEIMTVLWQIGAANVQTIHEHFRDRDLAYTTVQTMLNVLHRKGRVKRRLKGRAYFYSPLLTRKSAIAEALDDVLQRFFEGSADGLVLSMIETRHLTPEKLARIQRLVDQSGKQEPKKR